MMERTTPENLLIKKYESLLKGILPDMYKDHILSDKLNLLTKENSQLESTVSQLRHEISNLIEKRKFDTYENSKEKLSYKFHALSTELAKCLEVSGCDLSKFSNCYDQAIQSLQKWSKGFTNITCTMRSKLFSSNKQLLDFMHSILDELNNLRAHLTIVQNYIAVLEFNETNLRDALKRYENKNMTTRSVSVSRIDQIERGDREMPKRLCRNFILEIAPSNKHYVECRGDDIQVKFNKLKLSFEKVKNQKDRSEIETEKLLLQLKQTKEQLAFAEENASALEFSYENKIKRLNHIISRLKEMPKVEEMVQTFEKQMENMPKKHNRTRSNIILYSNS